ncbi:phytanoyl-CoA dioxygenase family protein [Kitasatospora kifunensis]|uniref:Ectoine hydroxylase-related dioxygenase (Phytanoyl-CoA dioxygenase family) n=1 Tax=Kitasatospora kifunensis TaxID=58351 RepID=A0A7W7R1C5_KITKI|nr:phytanoyl-CoA dioxygenase family protein [Kitasatospora kifunensis]MBB4923620.1 ectoine hydroxylase-related dioxygenase (phytanoyl-CoA dioxygenase family) [Kitasatospora kifunensis]
MPTPDPYLHRAPTARPYFSADTEAYLAQTPLREIEKALPLRVLSEEDYAFWQTYGYVVVKEAIPAEAAKQLLDFAWDFQGLDPTKPETWYEEQSFRSELDQELHVYGFVEAYHHQLIWDSRQAQRVYDAFVDVWDCEELWVTLDRLNLNPPNVRTRDRALIAPTDKGFDIELHWDVDTTLGVLPQRVQGIIALNDTQADHGGFQCNPELFRRFEEWKLAQPADRDPIRPDVDRSEFPVVRPELKAGDLLIWNGLLAHGVARNTSERGVRSVQYLSMMPALEEAEELRRSRVESWRDLSTPTWNRTLVGDAKRHESLRYGTAELNGLGEKLLGLRSWHGIAAQASNSEASSEGRSCAASA